MPLLTPHRSPSVIDKTSIPGAIPKSPAQATGEPASARRVSEKEERRRPPHSDLVQNMLPPTPRHRTLPIVAPSPPQTPTSSRPPGFPSSNGPASLGFVSSRSLPPVTQASNLQLLGNGVSLVHNGARVADRLSPDSAAAASESSSSASPPRSEASDHTNQDAARLNCPPPLNRARQPLIWGTFVVEECSDFDESDSDDRAGAIRPYAIEYADTDCSRARSRNPAEVEQTAYRLSTLHCGDGNDSDQAVLEQDEFQAFMQHAREGKRRRRMTSGSLGKRTITESLGSDSDREDCMSFLDVNEMGSSARRLRRRVGHRLSLHFMDPPRIEELEEPVSDSDELSDGEDGLRELPYYLYTSMEIDSP